MYGVSDPEIEMKKMKMKMEMSKMLLMFINWGDPTGLPPFNLILPQGTLSWSCDLERQAVIV